MSILGLVILFVGIALVGFGIYCLIALYDEVGSALFIIVGVMMIFGTLVIDLAPSHDESMYVNYATIQSLGEDTGAIKRYINNNYDLGYRGETYNDYIEMLNAWRAEINVKVGMGDKALAKLDMDKLEPLPTLPPTTP